MTEGGTEELALSKPKNDTMLPDRSITAARKNTRKHEIGITVFDDPENPEVFRQLSSVFGRYKDVFEDTGFANLPEEDWMQIHLKPGWEKKIPKKCRVYPVGPREQEVIEKQIEKLVSQDRMFRTKRSVPFSFPVFVVWRTLSDGTRKSRMVVDIRGLNKIVLMDSYPMKTQEEMMATIANNGFITVFDAQSFYYQWRTNPETGWALTITTHAGQYTFKCAVMGYKNSNAYVQRQMDTLLADTPAADCYCDDVVIASATLEDHIHDVQMVLEKMRRDEPLPRTFKVICRFPQRNCVRPCRQLLWYDHHRGTPGLNQTPKVPGDTEGAGHLHRLRRMASAVVRCSDDSARRTEGFAHQGERPQPKESGAPITRRQRKTWSGRVPVLQPSDREREAFQAVKKGLTANTMLQFFNSGRPLFVDFDVSGVGIGCEVYHIEE